MKLFFQYLNKQFISLDREDKYMAFRYKNFTRKESKIRLLNSTKSIKNKIIGER